MTTFSYGMKKTVALPIDQADARVREALLAEGFGVLTEIDVSATLKKKLDADFRPYRILGACNPTLAQRALTLEIDIGLLLPCNVVVYSGESADETVVSILDPVVQLMASGRSDIEPLAHEVRDRMTRVLEAI